MLCFFDDLIPSRIEFVEMLKLDLSTSTKIGIAPSKGTTSAEDAKVKDGTRIPSPGFTPNPNRLSNRASVPLEQHKTYLELQNRDNLF